MITLLIKASLVIAILLAFYKLFLEKESFFGTNRTYLLVCLGLTFALPFVTLPKMINEQGLVSSWIEKYVDNSEGAIAKAETTSSSELLEEQPVGKKPEQITNTSEVEISAPGKVMKEEADEMSTPPLASTPPPAKGKGVLYWLLMIYYFGVAIFSLNFIFQIGSVLMKVFKSTDRIHDVGNTIINSPLVTEPCSFFTFIFINPGGYDYDTYEQILAHEKIHVQKRHTYDLLLSEIAVILLWFNPIAWFFRKEVEKNIEYQTDDILLRGEVVEKENYQMNLLKVATYNMPLTITTNYNQSLIKQRIMKISAKKSNPQSLWKYAFTAPLLFSLLLLINKPMSAFAENTNPETTISNADSEARPNDVISLPKEEERTEETKGTTTGIIKPDIASFLAYYKNLSEADKSKLLKELKGIQNEKPEEIAAPVSESSNPFAQSEKSNTTQTPPAEKDAVIIGNNAEVRLFENLEENEKQVVLEILEELNVLDGEAIEEVKVDIKMNDKSTKITEGCGALLKAVRTENLADVKTLLEKIDPNCIVKDPGNETFIEGNMTWRILRAQTPLVAAGRVGNLEIMKLLVAKGVDVNLHGHSNETALMAAAKYGNLNMVRFLVMSGADVETLVQHWGSALSIASENGHMGIVKYLKSNKAEIDSRVAHVGTPLIRAAENGHVDIAKFLIENGADINVKEAHVGTPLIVAAKKGYLDLVKYFIENGADLNEAVAHVGTPLIEAAESNHLEVVKYLIIKGANPNQGTPHIGTPLSEATESGSLEVARYLIENGANINKGTAHVGTPLINAAEDGQLNAVKILIELGADIDKGIEHVGTPLIVAAEDGHWEVVKFLIEKGAKIDKGIAHVGTPLICAAQDGHAKVVELLIEKGAKMDRGVDHVGTPLLCAAQDGHLKVVKLLIEKGADIDKAVDHVGTPLIGAVEDGHMNVVKYLVSKGADVNKRVEHVGSPLSEAIENGQTKIEKYLRSKGAKR